MTTKERVLNEGLGREWLAKKGGRNKKKYPCKMKKFTAFVFVLLPSPRVMYTYVCAFKGEIQAIKIV